jgi:hypothetical protein
MGLGCLLHGLKLKGRFLQEAFGVPENVPELMDGIVHHRDAFCT